MNQKWLCVSRAICIGEKEHLVLLIRYGDESKFTRVKNQNSFRMNRVKIEVRLYYFRFCEIEKNRLGLRVGFIGNSFIINYENIGGGFSGV